MSISTQPYKGAKDYFPEDMRFRDWMFGKWRKTLATFGYEEYDAPILEPTELYLMKGNEEIIAEQTYSFLDRGKRSVTLRTEMTPSVSRMVAGKRQELVYPARLFSIPNIWRYERPQKGRARSFWQLNVDLFGSEGIEAEHEVISVADRLLTSFGAKRTMYEIRINNRTFVDFILTDYLKFDEVEAQTIIRIIDKKQKVDQAELLALLEASIRPSQREAGHLNRLMDILNCRQIGDLPTELSTHHEAIKIAQLLAMLEKSGTSNVSFDISLMRGFDYYTGVVFEVFDTDPENNRSMFGGGRFDGLVGMFGAEPVPTVGFGMGDATFEIFLKNHDLTAKLKSSTEVYVILTDGSLYSQFQPVLKAMRDENLNIAVDLSFKKVEKQLKSAIKLGVPFAMFVGKDEIESNILTIKNLSTYEEFKLSPERVISFIKDFRRQKS